MDLETLISSWKIFNAGGSVFLGILVSVMFVKALERKGRPALLLLPFAWWLLLWCSWQPIRHRWFMESYGYESPGFQLLYMIFERLITTTVVLLALFLIFKKDKPKPEDPPIPS